MNEKPKITFTPFLKLVVIFAVLIIIAFLVSDENKSVKSSNYSSKGSENLEKKLGKYLDYDFVYMEKDNKIVVTYPNKFLPRNDDIVVGAIKYTIKAAYNETLPVNTKPSLENRNGMNLIMVKGEKSNYYIQLIKEDTGEINSFILWGENN